MPSWLKTIQTKRPNQKGKLLHVWRSDVLPCTTQNADLLKGVFGKVSRHLSSLYSFSGKHWNRHLSRKTLNQSHISFRQKLFYRPGGTLVCMSCNLISTKHTLLVQLIQQLTFSPVWKWKSRRKIVSKSERMYKQHPLMWPHLPRMLQKKKNSSSHKQMVEMRQKNKTLNGKINPGKKQQNGWQIRNYSQWSQVLRNSHTRIDGNTTSYSLHWNEENARPWVQEDVDVVLKNLKLKTLGQPHDELLLTTDSRFKHYKANEDLIILKHWLLFRKY